ncbi:unnamed protein product [Allacma fusca]|uniref:Peptidase S1 domain-containing protein n=1 Tax=Allacma fusca TaxID=39272 RepID=A0A8J2NT72_9HEXA|nr:unnamed protein product [Allacma fusca]
MKTNIIFLCTLVACCPFVQGAIIVEDLTTETTLSETTSSYEAEKLEVLSHQIPLVHFNHGHAVEEESNTQKVQEESIHIGEEQADQENALSQKGYSDNSNIPDSLHFDVDIEIEKKSGTDDAETPALQKNSHIASEDTHHFDQDVHNYEDSHSHGSQETESDETTEQVSISIVPEHLNDFQHEDDILTDAIHLRISESNGDETITYGVVEHVEHEGAVLKQSNDNSSATSASPESSSTSGNGNATSDSTTASSSSSAASESTSESSTSSTVSGAASESSTSSTVSGGASESSTASTVSGGASESSTASTVSGAAAESSTASTGADSGSESSTSSTVSGSASESSTASTASGSASESSTASAASDSTSGSSASSSASDASSSSTVAGSSSDSSSSTSSGATTPTPSNSTDSTVSSSTDISNSTSSDVTTPSSSTLSSNETSTSDASNSTIPETTPSGDISETTTETTTTKKPHKKKPPYNAVLNCRCGTQTTKRVEVGTLKVDTNVHPWTVMINNTQGRLCSGNIINSKFIITSASCLRGHSVRELTIKAALTVRNKTIRFTPERISIHPAYNPNTQENNIALLEVKEIIHPSKTVKFICLPISDDNTNSTGTLVTLARDPSTKEVILYTEQVKQITNRRCAALAKRNINKNTFCSAPPSRHCDEAGGDGGAYIVPGKGYSFTIKGLVYSAGCKRKSKPAVYTKVEKYINWILYKTKSAQYCKAPSYRRELSKWAASPE